ncbi:MAG: hypothetical protein WCP68_03250 [Enhydrobacter sp.]
MSLKGRLRPLARRVEWLETEGRFRRIALMIKILEMKQEIADRLATDPAAAAQWKKDYPNVPCELPPPSPHLRPRAPEPEAAPRVVPIGRDAAVPAAPQDEESADRSTNTGLTLRSERLEGPEPAPPPAPTPAPRPVMPGQPVAPPPPDMEIRPVHWRPRGARDYYDEDEPPGTNGRCITEYDPLRDEYDDEDG